MVEHLSDRAMLAGDFGFVNTFAGTGEQSAQGVATDSAGNVYITGNYRNTVDFDPGPGVLNFTTANAPEVFVAKYTSTGNLVWARSFGTPSGIDEANALAIDSGGNVWVVGRYQGIVDFDPGSGIANLIAVGDLDGFVLKLDANGAYQWAGSIGGLNGESLDGVAVDAAGNVLVAGQFNGTADFDPGPGTFPLTSLLNGSTTTFDACLLKLDNAGTFQWAKGWGGNSTSSPNGDWARDVATDAAGNAYVHGSFVGAADLDPGPGTVNVAAGTSFARNIFVSKFDSTGNLAWGRSFVSSSESFAGDIAVDAIGNVYTTGGIQTLTDFDPGPGAANLAANPSWVDAYISKLDTNGNYQWAVDFGNTNGNAEGFSIAVDDNGDVYSVGRISLAAAADFDPSANVFNLASTASNDIYVSRLDSGGRYISARRMGGTGNDRANAVALNPVTNEIFIAGQYTGAADFDPGAGTVLRDTGSTALFTDDIFFCKLTQNQFSGRVWNDLNANGLIDAGEPGVGEAIVEIVVTPSDPTQGNSDDRVIGVIASDADGNYSFTIPHQSQYYARFYPPTGNGSAYRFTLNTVGLNALLDSDVLLPANRTGTFSRPPGVPYLGINAGLIEVPSDLAFAFGIGGGGTHIGRTVAQDSAGRIAVGGRFTGGPLDLDPSDGISEVPHLGGDDAFIAVYEADGSLRWGHSLGGIAGDIVESAAFDSAGNLVVVGAFGSTAYFGTGPSQATLVSAGIRDLFVAKFDPDGNLLWAQKTGGTGDDQAFSVSIDEVGDVYVAGQAFGTIDFDPGPGTIAPPAIAGQWDSFVWKLNSAGVAQWASRVSGSGTDTALSIDVRDGRVYAAGTFAGVADFDPGPGTASRTASGTEDAYVWRLSAASGGLELVLQIGGIGPDQGVGVAVDADANIHVAGTFRGPVDFDLSAGVVSLTASFSDPFVAKYSPTGTLLWAQQATGGGFDAANGLSLDEAGNVWTTGSFLSTVDFAPGAATSNLTSAGSADIFLWGLDEAGQLVAAYRAGALNFDAGASVAVNSEGNRVASTGFFEQAADFDPGLGLVILTSMPTPSPTATTQDAYLWVFGFNRVPSDIVLASALVAENSLPGTVVGDLGVIDPDAGNVHTLQLLDDAAGRFAIVGNQLVVASGVDLDFETVSTHSIIVRATDFGGKSVEKMLTVTVQDVNEAPVVSMVFAAGGDEGSLLVGSGSFTDPDAGDSWMASVDYGDGSGVQQLVLNPDGTFALEHTYGDNGNFRVSVVVTDSGALPGSATAPVEVANVDPVVHPISGPAIAVRGQLLHFASSGYDDAGLLDTHELSWEVLDAASAVVATGSSANFSFTPTEIGQYTVHFTVTDDDDGFASRSLPLMVEVANLQVDPCEPNKLALFVGGTLGNDTIVIKQAGVSPIVNGVDYGDFFPNSAIYIFAQAGDDTVNVPSGMLTAFYMQLGDGNDIAYGGGAPDLISGGNGNDQIFGRGAGDMLVGGDGADLLEGGAGEDLLIAGYTAFDHDLALLDQIFTEWWLLDDYSDRSEKIRGIRTEGSNQGHYLIVSGPGQTVFDDEDADTVKGGSALDLYFADLSDSVIQLSGNEELHLTE